ncbi:MAG: DEAD/DEAH box helicase, partial [Anaerotardibacter sp.]
MLISLLANSVESSGSVGHFWTKLDSYEDATLGVASSARPFLVAARFAKHPQTTLVVTAGEEAADSFERMVSSFVGEEKVCRFPLRTDNPFSLEPKRDLKEIAQRMEALWALQSQKEMIVVASARALLRKIAPAECNIAKPLVLIEGADLFENEIEDLGCFEDLAPRLVEMGYENTETLEGPGTFCVHGGTVDIFPGNLKFPVRLDFFGDELEEIRKFLPSTGQTIGSVPHLEIYPVQEFCVTPKQSKKAQKALIAPAQTNPALRELYSVLEDDSKEYPDALLPYVYDHLETVADYLGPDCLAVLIEPRSLFDDALHYADELEKKATGTSIPYQSLFTLPQQLSFGSCTRATYVSIMRVGVELDDELIVKRVDVAGDPEKLYGRLISLTQAGFSVAFSIPNFRARTEIKLELVDRGIPFVERLDVMEEVERDKALQNQADNDASDSQGVKNASDVSHVGAEKTSAAKKSHSKRGVGTRLKRGMVTVVDVDIPLGMIFPAMKLALVSLADTQGSMTARKTRRVDVTEITFPYKPGDCVVHAAHGIALFKEIVRQEVGGSERDYLLLEYAENDKLYVPVEQLDRVTRYVGPEGSSPRLTRLNTSDWSRAITKARKATKKLAFDLVDVYTRRAATKGYQYKEDTPWQREMEESFPYQETPDQIAAINDIKADMQSAHPMDRLVCGDVGFGKTEVALRAAFKATQDNKQVMVLCPTTILAQQHYTTFHDRFEPFGVRVDVLSRFRTPAQQKESLAGFSDGSVQVLVGTHRLLSRDVNPKDLGLVIIDEEQRFGVGHKEQMKNLRESIDVLTLSATPIPRTMQMGLSGVRDMSIILTPPDDRRAVKVHVGEWDPDLVSDAIRRELSRGGQVYYVSNRVRTIENAVERVKTAAGEARVGVAHGKMTKEQLEHVMEEFAAGELDVL